MSTPTALIKHEAKATSVGTVAKEAPEEFLRKAMLHLVSPRAEERLRREGVVRRG